MTSSSSPLHCGLDTMILVYSLLQGHPAATACEQLLRAHVGWFTSPWVLLEAKAVLTTKVYGEDPALVTQKLAQIAHGPVVLVDLARTDVITVLQFADTHALDLRISPTPSCCILVHRHGARFLASDDQRLSLVCSQFGITPLSPLDSALRQAVGAWEASHVPPKGLPRAPPRPPVAEPFAPTSCSRFLIADGRR